jgi:hypothetical protein
MASPSRRPTAADLKWALAAEIDRLRDENARLAAENERLKAAISWIEQPFIDENTPEHELRARIKFAVDDAARARAFLALTGGKDGE